jgi:hypothetical protein
MVYSNSNSRRLKDSRNKAVSFTIYQGEDFLPLHMAFEGLSSADASQTVVTATINSADNERIATAIVTPTSAGAALSWSRQDFIQAEPGSYQLEVLIAQPGRQTYATFASVVVARR